MEKIPPKPREEFQATIKHWVDDAAAGATKIPPADRYRVQTEVLSRGAEAEAPALIAWLERRAWAAAISLPKKNHNSDGERLSRPSS